MTAYTITYEYDEDPLEVTEVDCAGDDAAVTAARAHLQLIIEKSPMLKLAEAAVGEGAMGAGDPRWIGKWRWTNDDEETWVWLHEG
jgi:hypothetical protein